MTLRTRPTGRVFVSSTHIHTSGNPMTNSDWQPGPDQNTLIARSKLYQRLRQFFAERNVMEVDVPVLASSAGTDPHIELIPAQACQQQVYLQTSPEFFMKRLLANGSGDIYSLGKAFRNEESGPRHNPEFTMLEWYRLGLDDQQLINEVLELIQHACGSLDVHRFSYRELFESELGINPHSSDSNTLQTLAKQHIELDWQDDDRDVWLDLLMTHIIEPKLPQGLCAIYDYPHTQAALARIGNNAQGDRVARRFEIYLDGIELANGYWELSDATEQQQRFQQDRHKRQTLSLPDNPVDQKFLAALQSGFPDCAGVALGVDRLLMAITGSNHIDQVMAFSFKRT